MRNIVLVFIAICALSLQSQSTYKTNFEAAIFEPSQIIELERNLMVNNSGLYIHAAVANNLITNKKTSGVIIGKVNQLDAGGKNSYIDIEEIPNLIIFFEKCHKQWKNENNQVDKKYSFFTKGGLNIYFHAQKGSEAWNFIFDFTEFPVDNSKLLSEKESEDFYNASLKLKEFFNL